MNLALSHWSANVVVLAACGVVAAVHLLGTAAIGRAPVTGAGAQAAAQRAGWPARAATQAAAFYCGLLVVALAVASPIGYWAQRYVWVRSVQDMLLAVVAPALIVLGAPWLALVRGSPWVLWRTRAEGPAPGSVPVAGRAMAAEVGQSPDLTGRVWLTWPVAVTVAFNVAWWAWHLPAAYDTALRYPWMYAAEVVVYLGLGLAFWLQLIGSDPFTPRFAPLRRVVLLTGTLVSSTVLAMVLVFGSGLMYRAYLGDEHRVLAVVADQQVGGAVLWAGSLPPFLITVVALVLRWLGEEESDALTAGFGRLLGPQRSAWPSRPGLR